MAQYIKYYSASSPHAVASWLEKWINAGYTIQQFQIVPSDKASYKVFALLILDLSGEEDFLPQKRNNHVQTR